MDTKTDILDAGEALMKRAGYSGFSYADVAKRVNIRKASLHYHFPSKGDLARQAVARYPARMSNALSTIDPHASTTQHAIQGLGPVLPDAFPGPAAAPLPGRPAPDRPASPPPVPPHAPTPSPPPPA